MPTSGKCRLFKRKDGKYLIYVPLKVAEDSMFPFTVQQQENGQESIQLKISFQIGKKRLIVEALEKEDAP